MISSTSGHSVRKDSDPTKSKIPTIVSVMIITFFVCLLWTVGLGSAIYFFGLLDTVQAKTFHVIVSMPLTILGVISGGYVLEYCARE